MTSDFLARCCVTLPGFLFRAGVEKEKGGCALHETKRRGRNGYALATNPALSGAKGRVVPEMPSAFLKRCAELSAGGLRVPVSLSLFRRIR